MIVANKELKKSCSIFVILTRNSSHHRLLADSASLNRSPFSKLKWMYPTIRRTPGVLLVPTLGVRTVLFDAPGRMMGRRASSWRSHAERGNEPKVPNFETALKQPCGWATQKNSFDLSQNFHDSSPSSLQSLGRRESKFSPPAA